MVVLVKCPDNSYTLTKESLLTDLINEGLVVEVLRNGIWVTAIRAQTSPESITGNQPKVRLSCLALS